jgi:hypothetical protein
MIFPDENHHFDDDEFEPQGSANRVRLRVTIFAIIMISALLGGLIFQAWSAVPALLGYWRSEYRLVFTDISPGDCSRRADTGRALCICGTLDAQQSEADFDINIHTQAGASLGKIALRDQSSGSFCHTMQLVDPLEPGRYVLVGTPRMGRNTIVRVLFTVPDNRPTF